MDKSPEDIIEGYLIERKLEYKEQNQQFNIKPTPCCGDDKWHHFYLSKHTGLWDCKKCGAQGNFDSFRKFWGDDAIMLPQPTGEEIVKPKEYKVLDYNIARGYASAMWSGLSDSAKYIEYLKTKRGLTEDTLKKFRIGVSMGNISIPIFDKDDNLTNIRYRVNPFDTSKADGPRYFTEKGCRSILFNEKVLSETPKEVYLTEGEFDALQLWQRGLKYVVSTTLGAGYFSEEWADAFADIKRIYICYDNDRAGREGAVNAAKKLGTDRCRIVELPKVEGRKKTDLTEFFVDDGNDLAAFKKLVSKAKMPSVIEEDVIKHISELDADLRKRLLEGDYNGLSTGFTALDNIMGGYRKGRLIVLSGWTSVGKTSFVQNLVLSMAHRALTSMFVSLEMPPVDIYKKFIQLQARIGNADFKQIDGETHPVMLTVDKTLGEFKNFPIYVYNGHGELNLKVLLDVCRTAKEVYNAQAIVIDHLQYFTASTSNKVTETSNATRALKAMAVELDLPVILLVHVSRKGMNSVKKGMYVPNLQDLKDSGSIEQDADQVVFVCRDSESSDEDEKRKAVIKVAKNRDGATGYASYDFQPEYQIFSEVVAGVDYLQEARTSGRLKDTSKSEDEPEIASPVLF